MLISNTILFDVFLNSMVFGTVTGIVIVDIMQKTCLLNMGTPDLYGSADPYQRTPRSPKKTKSQGLGDIVEQCMADAERYRPNSGAGMQEQVKSHKHYMLVVIEYRSDDVTKKTFFLDFNVLNTIYR